MLSTGSLDVCMMHFFLVWNAEKHSIEYVAEHGHSTNFPNVSRVCRTFSSDEFVRCVRIHVLIMTLVARISAAVARIDTPCLFRVISLLNSTRFIWEFGPHARLHVTVRLFGLTAELSTPHRECRYYHADSGTDTLMLTTGPTETLESTENREDNWLSLMILELKDFVESSRGTAVRDASPRRKRTQVE